MNRSLLTFGLVASCSISATLSAADAQPPDAAGRELGKHLASYFDPVQTLQFDYEVSYKHALEPSTSYEMADAFYGYDRRQSKHYLRATHSQLGAMKAAQTPGGYRRWVEKGSSKDPQGTIEEKDELTWESYGPQGFVKIALVELIRSRLENGEFLVRFSEGPDSDPELLVPFDQPPFDLKRAMWEFIALDRQRGFAPYRFSTVVSGMLRRQNTMELFEARPGLWLPERAQQLVWHKDPVNAFLCVDFQMDKGSLRINEAIPDSLFDLVFPAGTAVSDNVRRTDYMEGAKPGQATQARVLANAGHAKHIAPVQPLGQAVGAQATEQPVPETTPPVTGTVTARYDFVPFYRRAWVWTLAGSLFVVAWFVYLYVLRRG